MRCCNNTVFVLALSMSRFAPSCYCRLNYSSTTRFFRETFPMRSIDRSIYDRMVNRNPRKTVQYTNNRGWLLSPPPETVCVREGSAFLISPPPRLKRVCAGGRGVRVYVFQQPRLAWVASPPPPSMACAWEGPRSYPTIPSTGVCACGGNVSGCVTPPPAGCVCGRGRILIPPRPPRG